MKKLLIIFSLLFSILNAQNNCPATQICAPYSATPNGFGVQELNATNDGCLSGEHNSTWLTVTILTGGTFTFTIDPNVNSNDFDYGVWGPNSPCPPTTQPIRCSYAVQGGNGNTGLSTTAIDNSEGVFGDQWTSQLNVVAGQTYLILVDNFTTNNGFNISFGGTAILDCNLLPIELLNLGCRAVGNVVVLEWTTLTENNNDYFIIEKYDSTRSVWYSLDTIDGSGNSNHYINYNTTDLHPSKTVNFYRLKQVDFNGVYEIYGPIYCDYSPPNVWIVMYTDILGRKIEDIDSYKGFYIELYSNGTTKKKFK